ncbi:hypothetical protein B0H13DRAFT_1560421, partial [Mycena leptocephala]
MPGRPKSNTKKAQLDRAAKDGCYARAVVLYQEEKARILAPGERRKGGRKICDIVEKEYYRDHRKCVNLSTSTLDRLANGGIPKSASNAAKGWLLPEEAEIVIQYPIDVASRGFPLTHLRLKECVDSICRARLGDQF